MFSLGVLQSVREMQNSTPVSQKELRMKGKKLQAQQIQLSLPEKKLALGGISLLSIPLCG